MSLARRKLAPPAGSSVYELTEWGRELEPIVIAIGRWGMSVPLPAGPIAISANSVLIGLRTFTEADPHAASITCLLELDGGVWTVRIETGRLDVQPGDDGTTDAVLRTDPKTLVALVNSPDTLDDAVRTGLATAYGDLTTVRRLLTAATIPPPPN